MNNLLLKTIMMMVIFQLSVLLAIPTAVAQDITVDNIGYNVDLTKMTAVAVSSNIPESVKCLTVPHSIEYKGRSFSVVAIIGAFACNETIEEAFVSEGISDMYDAFAECPNLKKVHLPSTYNSLGYNFYQCTSLTSVFLNQPTIKIAKSDFEDCSSLKSLSIPVKSIGHSGLKGCSSLASVEFIDPVDGYIDWYAFAGCSNLKSLKIKNIDGYHFNTGSPYSLTIDVLPGAFYGCSNLEELELPGGVICCSGYGKDDSRTFQGCNKLRKVVLLHHVRGYRFVSLGRTTEGTEYFEDVYLPFSDIPLSSLTVNNDSDKNRGTYAPQTLEELIMGKYVRCFSIFFMPTETKITLFPITPPSVRDDIFTNHNFMENEILVPNEALDAYKSHPVWGKFWNIKALDNSDVNKTLISQSAKRVVGKISPNGQLVDENYKGIVIIQYDDGSVKKVIQK